MKGLVIVLAGLMRFGQILGFVMSIYLANWQGEYLLATYIMTLVIFVEVTIIKMMVKNIHG